jgi:hypothetical protein
MFWYFNTILLLKRPSPRNPASKDTHILTCYSAAISIIQIAFVQLDHDIRSITFTWSDVHHLIMAAITFMFTLWNYQNARIKARKDILAVRAYLWQLRVVIDKMSIRWPQIARTQQILKVLTKDTIEFLELVEERKASGQRSSQRTGRDCAQQRANSSALAESSKEQLGSSNCYSSLLHLRDDVQSEAPSSGPHMFGGNVSLSPHTLFSANSLNLPQPHSQLTHNLSQERTTCTLPAAAECIPAPGISSNHNFDHTSRSDGYAHVAFSSMYEGGVNNYDINDQQSLWNNPMSTPFPGDSAWMDFPWDDNSDNDILPFDLKGVGLANYLDLFGDFSANEQVFPYNASAGNPIQGQGSYNSALNFQRSPDP